MVNNQVLTQKQDVMKTGHEWLLVESSKLQDRTQRNCVIRNLTVESVELSDHNVSMNVEMSIMHVSQSQT